MASFYVFLFFFLSSLSKKKAQIIMKQKSWHVCFTFGSSLQNFPAHSHFFLIIPQKSRNHKSWPVEVLGPVVDEDVDEDVEEDVVEVVVGPCVFIIME